MKKILDKNFIEYIFDGLNKDTSLENIIIATISVPPNDELISYVKKQEIQYANIEFPFLEEKNYSI